MNSNEELNQAKYLTVSALNRYLSYKFDVDVHLQSVYLEGEISNFKVSGRHMYFSLKDENSEISAMMFYPTNTTLDFMPEDGMTVQLKGTVSVYEKRGTYSIIVKKMIRSGVGLLYQQFLDLKDKLQKEGLFDQAKKKKLPLYPRKIAVITSATGEAINDITSTIRKRYPLAKVVLYPALVQGSDAPMDLIRALNESYLDKSIDLLIIGRGGGSFEDLSCFNDEILARTLYNAPFPTISAVGHEGDYTICDFIASLRAPTPTGAAMLAVQDQHDIKEYLSQIDQRLISGYRSFINHLENKTNNLCNSHSLMYFDQLIDQKLHNVELLESKLMKNSPSVVIDKHLQEVNHLKNTLNNDFIHYVDRLNNEFTYKLDKLIVVNPLNLMKKGYSIVYQNQNVISNVKNLKADEPIRIQMTDGLVDASIIKISEE